MSPPREGDWSASVPESTEFPLDLVLGTAKNWCGSALPFAVGEDTLCGEVGLLSLLSKEFAGRSSGDLDVEGAVVVAM